MQMTSVRIVSAKCNKVVDVQWRMAIENVVCDHSSDECRSELDW